MGCNCGKRAGIKYEVKMADGSVLGKYESVSAAQSAGEAAKAQSGGTYTFKAVPA